MYRDTIEKNLLSKQVNELTNERMNLIKLQNDISTWKSKALKIQSNFNFELPNYILDEIITNENKFQYKNLHFLINCAVINGKISKTNGSILKQTFLH